MMTIVNLKAVRNYPFTAIAPRALELLTDSIAIEFNNQSAYKNSLKLFEAFLCLTSQRFGYETADSEKYLLTDFIGALWSETFLKASVRMRWTLSTAWQRLIHRSCYCSEQLQIISIHSTKASPSVEILRKKFDGIKLTVEQIYLWRGWPIENKTGKTRYLNFRSIYEKFGKLFTDQLYLACRNWFGARSADRIPGLKEFLLFITSSNAIKKPKDLRDPYIMQEFWIELLTFYSHQGVARKISARTAAQVWNSGFLGFVRDALYSNGIVDTPWDELPAPNFNDPNPNYHVRSKNGTLISQKLLTSIPLEITDDEAIQIIFREIENDVNIVARWARQEIDKLWERFCRRKEINEGTPRILGETYRQNGGRWLCSDQNPYRMENAIATYKHYGFCTRKQIRSLHVLYPDRLPEVAEYLGLPTSHSFFPHCALLVKKNPEITPAFLEGLKLFSDQGTRIGLIKTDAGHYLVGNKPRKGAALAEQKILLDQESLIIVRQIIAITHDIRKYLKREGNKKWQYLLLSTQKGFGQPTCASLTDSAYSAQNTKNIEQQCNQLEGISADISSRLARDLTLPRLRASAGILVLLRTKSTEKMAKALGHTEYNGKLLKRYLPPMIYEFLLNRWLKIFQTGLVAEAMKDSNLILAATNFETLDQLDCFLKKHAFKKNQNNGPKLKTEISKKLVISVDKNILVALLSLSLAVEKATNKPGPKALYWATVCTEVVAYIDSDACLRPDVREYLSYARAIANARTFKDLIYE